MISTENNTPFPQSRAFFILCLFLLLASPLLSVTVDLREPTFSEGVLRTEKGGVINAPNLRVQAQNIVYTHKETDCGLVVYLEAEEDLIVEFGEYIFVGRRLEYDFEAKKGILYDGRTGVEPWFIGGKEVHLCPDGSYIIHDGFATTSENYITDWQIETEQAHLSNNRFLTAKNVKFRFLNFPLFWMPRFRINLDSIFDSPFRYTVRFGGAQGTRVGISYDAFDWKGIKTRLRLDYRFSRGFGGGAEIDYKSPNHLEHFNAVNYIAQDTTRYDRKGKTRYRYSGVYSNILDCGKTSILGTYDVLSDKEMATDYSDKGLRLESARRTQIEVRRQENNWIVNCLARFRVNSFQTVKQELPTLSGSLRPIDIGNTGIISDTRFKLSYLELEFTDDRPEGHDFNSPRYELYNNFYRPFKWQKLNITPQAGVLAIYYGNNPDRFDRWTTLGLFELDINTDLYRFYGNYKHVLSPYARYQYYTHPETSPDDHFIFDIDDGWYRLNMLRIGVNNNLYTKTCDGCIYRKLFTDFFVYSFFDTETIDYEVPKAYAKVVYNVSPFMRNTLIGGWDIERNMLDHWNYRIEWTVSTKAAIAAEYRHRSPFDWRKVDHTNFIMDSFREEEELRDSEISDRRDTVLLNFYYKFHPNWALGLQSRNGWNRHDEPDYYEYQVDFLGTFRSSWHLRVSYRHREDDDRFSFNFSIGLKRPEPINTDCFIPCLEF